jgi:catalase
VALLVADGCEDEDVDRIIEALTSQGAQTRIVSPRLGYVRSSAGNELKVHFSLLTASSVLFDAVYVPAGVESVFTLLRQPSAIEFIREAYRHCKAIGVSNDAVDLLAAAHIATERNEGQEEGILVATHAKFLANFVAAIAGHRAWSREPLLRPDLGREDPAA